MAKKKWLFHIFKKLFLCEAESLQAKKNKRWGWISGNCKKVKQLGELRSESKLEDAREEQMKHAMNVARATAVAAEAAVAAAQAAAAAVVRLTGMPNTHKEMKDWAATRIQTAFRAYLARKALRALKGLVRLQAIVRGQAVRRHLRNELKRSPSSTKLICLGRNPSSDSDAGIRNGCKFRPIVRRRKELGEAVRAERLWNNEMYSNEELNSPSLRRQKDCMRQYSYSHRERHMQFAQILEEPLSSGSYSDRHGFWVRQPWASGKPERREEHGNLATTSRSKLQRRVLRREHCMEEESYSPLSNPRRSLCQLRERSSGELSPSACSSIYPSYMGSTESAKAKMRSMSTPRHRIRYLDNYHSNCHECGGTSYKNTWAAALNCQAMTQDSNCSHHLRSLSMRSLKH